MSSYGRNFGFRTQADGPGRRGRYINDATAIPFGAAVKVDTAAGEDVNGRLKVQLASGTSHPKPGINGIALKEFTYDAYSGSDPVLTTFSDKDTLPAHSPCYLVSGPDVKVVFRNTHDRSFYGQRNYPGRIMVAGAGATPTVAVGDWLRPADTPNDTNGYWQETSTEAEAWLVVTSVNVERGEVEAVFNF